MGVLDAWAYGIPVITTPVGGIVDIIQDGINGLIYNIYDIQKLSDNLSILISSEKLRNKIVTETDKLVKNEFNISTINKQLDYIYSSI